MNMIQKLASDLQPHYPAREAQNIAKILLEDLLGRTAATLFAPLTPAETACVAAAMRRLQAGEPVQYVTARADFYGKAFYVNAAVLIPRPETEELVHLIHTAHPKNANLRVLDIGTGSGCIAILLQLKHPAWHLTALDVSAAALAVAKKNAEKLGANLHFAQSDILDNRTWAHFAAGSLDIIVSNPPYVLERDKAEMHPNVLDFEPHTALFVPDNDPLLFYRAIAAFAAQKLRKNGSLYLEIHCDYGATTVALLQKTGHFTDIILQQDMAGRDRMIAAMRA